jgi:hypothetical protein
MEHFRSSGTSGGLIHRRTQSKYVKGCAASFLQRVGQADAYVIARGKLRGEDLVRLRAALGEVVSESWLARNAAHDAVIRLTELHEATLPADADRAISDVLRLRFPDETVRPELNSRWG